MADYDQNSLIPRLGMYALPYQSSFPGLGAQLAQLYRDRVARIGWLPSGWLEQVLALNDANGYVLIPGYVTTPGMGTPWLDTPEKAAWWRDFASRASAIVSQTGADAASRGKLQLALLYADELFWSGAYRIASVLAYPVTVGKQVLDDQQANIRNLAIIAGAGLVVLLLVNRR